MRHPGSKPRPHFRQAAAPKARRRLRPPDLYPERTGRRLPHGEAGRRERI